MEELLSTICPSECILAFESGHKETKSFSSSVRKTEQVSAGSEDT